MDRRLEEAAQTGDVEVLYSLVEEDPCVLENIDEIPFADTPLHLAAASGHIAFAMQTIILKPSYAMKLNRKLFSPMHLALQNNHTQMVLQLLKFDKGLVRVKGREGKTPLHWVVEQGDLDLLMDFLKVCPESIRDVTIKGENALHLAIKANMFGVLQIILSWLQRFCHKNAQEWENEVLNGKDQDGNTALHTALYGDQQQAVELLSDCRKVKKDIKNSEGFTAEKIIKCGIDRLRRERTGGGSEAPTQADPNPVLKRLRSKISLSDKIWTYIIRLRLNITNETSSALLIVFALVITIGIQGILSPPGGVWQADADESKNVINPFFCNVTCNNATSLNCNLICNSRNVSSNNSRNSSEHTPGMSVMDQSSFIQFWLFDTVALVSSFIMTGYLLPPSIMAILFSVTLLYSFYSLYQMALLVISPVKYIGVLAWIPPWGAHIVLGLLWYYMEKGKHWFFAREDW